MRICSLTSLFVVFIFLAAAGCSNEQSSVASDQNGSLNDAYVADDFQPDQLMSDDDAGNIMEDTGEADNGGEPGNDAIDDVADNGAVEDAPEPQPDTDNGGTVEKFSFFVTSLASLQELSKSQNGFGGDLRYGETGAGAGLRGADKICTEIAEKSMPGASAKQWRAFLSVSKDENGNKVNAIDRIGEGPWYDRLGRVIALNKTALLNNRPQGADAAVINDLPNEYGVPNHRPDPTQAQVDNHHMLTGSTTKGLLYSATATCSDWTSTAASGSKPRVGLSWPRQGGGGGGGGSSNWMSAMDESGCGAGINLVDNGPGNPNGTVGSGGGYGGFYCFALEP